MDSQHIPYVLFSVPHRYYCIECGNLGRVKLFLAICLMDHYVVGSGPTRSSALQDLEARFHRKYDGRDPEQDASDCRPPWRIV